MQLGHSADEIKYLDTIGTLAVYVVILDGEPTMNILCDSADETKAIKIAKISKADKAQTTKGQFELTSVMVEGPDGPVGMETRVDEKSVYRYVVPRLHVLLGRLLRAA